MNKLLTIFLSLSLTCSSAQTGISWSPPSDIAGNAFSNQHPRITLDGSGNPMVIWGKAGDQSVYFSKWTGSMFTVPIRLNPDWMGVATAGWMGPDIASKGDTVYVVVKRAPEQEDTNRIFLFSSYDGGISFNTPVELAFIGTDKSRFPTVTTDEFGNPIVAFMRFNAAFLESRWVVTTSEDLGNSFSADVKSSGWGNSAEVCDCCPGAIVSSGDNVAMLYRDNNSNYRNTWVGISDDNGSTFDKGFAVDANNWFIMSCPSSGPDGVIIGDTLYTTFMSGGSGNYRTYLSKSSLGSGSLVTMDPTGLVPGLGTQNYPRIASDGQAMAVVWQQTVNGEVQLPIQFTPDISNGTPLTYEIVDMANITNADVALNDGRIFVVWQDDGSGTVKYRTGTYTSINTAIQTLPNEEIRIFPSPATAHLTISINQAVKDAEIRIFNMLGVEVLFQPGTTHQNLDISALHNGKYLLQLKTNNQFYNASFIKQ